MPEIRSVVNTSLRYFNILFYDIKCISKTSLKLYVSSKHLAKCLNGTIEVVGDIKLHHVEQVNSSTH